MKRLLRSRLLPLALLALGCLATQAHAGFSDMVFTNSAKQADGLYLYSYAVSNTGTVAISEFDVAVNDPIGLSNISSPLDFFNFYTPGDPSISFIATDAGLTPGMIGVFSFESASGPGQVADQVLGFDPTSGSPVFTQGFVLGAAVVPEPSSLTLLGLGSVGLIGLLARSRARRRPVG